MTHDEAWVEAQAERMAFRESIQEEMAAMIRGMAERGEINVDPENVNWGTPPPLVQVTGTWYRIDSLDAALAETLAALPEGCTLRLEHDPSVGDLPSSAAAVADVAWRRSIHVDAETPVAALRALAAKLRERAG